MRRMKVILFDFVNVVYNPKIHRLNDDVIQYIQELNSKSIPLYLFTNISSKQKANYEKSLDFLKYFVTSTDGDKYIKPHKEAYMGLEKLTGSQYKDMILIDDSLENIQQAENFRMKGILYTNIDELKFNLNKELEND